MNESWVPVVGWSEYYQVSDQGQVWSNEGTMLDRWGNERPKAGQTLQQFIGDDGRPRVTLCRWGRRWDVCVHTLVAEAFHGPRPPGKDCCHDDGDSTNNRASNLRWDTPGGNVLDEVRHGTHRNSRKTHCPMDHPLAHPNLYEQKSARGTPAYRCKSCMNTRMAIASRVGSGKGAHLRPEFRGLADAQCDRIMPGWRDWIPPEGFTRSQMAG